MSIIGIPPVSPAPAEPVAPIDGETFAHLLALATTGDDQRQAVTEVTDVLADSAGVDDPDAPSREEVGDALVPPALPLPAPPPHQPEAAGVRQAIPQATADPDVSEGEAMSAVRGDMPVAVSPQVIDEAEQPGPAAPVRSFTSHQATERAAEAVEVAMAPVRAAPIPEPRPATSDLRLAAAVAVLRAAFDQVASEDTPDVSRQAPTGVVRVTAPAPSSTESANTDGESADPGNERQPPRQVGMESQPASDPARNPFPMPASAPVGSPAARPPSPVVAPADVPPTPAESTAGTPRMVTLQVNAPDGSVARIRVALVGDAVRATIVAEPAAAATLESALPELRRALGDQGFNDSQVTVRSVGTELSPLAATRTLPASEGRATDQQQHRDQGEQPRGNPGRDDRPRQQRHHSPDRDGR